VLPRTVAAFVTRSPVCSALPHRTGVRQTNNETVRVGRPPEGARNEPMSFIERIRAAVDPYSRESARHPTKLSVAADGVSSPRRNNPYRPGICLRVLVETGSVGRPLESTPVLSLARRLGEFSRAAGRSMRFDVRSGPRLTMFNVVSFRHAVCLHGRQGHWGGAKRAGAGRGRISSRQTWLKGRRSCVGISKF